MLVGAWAAWLAEPGSGEKWLKQSSRVEPRRDFVMAVSSSFQKLLLLIRRVRRLSGVALSGFPAAEPLLGPIFTIFGPGGVRETLVGEARQDYSVLGRRQKPVCALLVRTWPIWPSNPSTASSP